MIVLLVAGPVLAQTAEHAGAHGCEAMLARAKVLEKEHGGTPQIAEAVTAFERAFERCAAQDVGPALAARVAAARGDVLFVYQHDAEGALAVLKEGLKAVTAALGVNAPERIALLDEMSSIYGSNAATGLTESPGADRVRAMELVEEALRVRKVAYGARSLEAAKGLVLLAAGEHAYRPDLAEKYSREALEIAREHDGGVNSQIFNALAMLGEALRSQGRIGEAETVEEESSEVIRRLEAAGLSLDS